MTESENCDSKYQKVVNHLIITQRLKGKDSKKQTNKKKTQTQKKTRRKRTMLSIRCFIETLMGTTKHRCSTDKKHKNRKLRKHRHGRQKHKEKETMVI